MRCTDVGCLCVDHISPETHVPCCPTHGEPLVAGERPGFGRCIAERRVRSSAKHVGGSGFVREHCITWSSASWNWRPRVVFDYRDLPPANGWQPVDVSTIFPDVPRFRIDVVRRCLECEIDVPHAQVRSTLVCLKCGRGTVEQS